MEYVLGLFFFSLTNAKSTKTASIGCVRVSSDHEQSREGIVLEDNLMDDTGAWLPESNAVLSARGLQELVYFFVDVLRGNYF